MHRDPVAAGASAHQESTGEGHEKHQNRNNSESDAGVIAIRRRAPPRPAALAVVSVIASAGRRCGAAAADVFNDEFDVRNCGCARHGEFLYSPDWRALTTCSGARCCGTKSSATSGTLNS